MGVKERHERDREERRTRAAACRRSTWSFRGQPVGPLPPDVPPCTAEAPAAHAAEAYLSRLIRGQVLSLRAKPFMEACRAIGVGAPRQFTAHLLPNLVGPIAVYAALAVPAAILSESFLSFLGIGVREPLPSWGNMAADGLGELNTVDSRWWLLVVLNLFSVEKQGPSCSSEAQYRS